MNNVLRGVQTLVAVLGCAVVVFFHLAAAAADPARGKENAAIPDTGTHGTSLQFSPNPTEQEIFRAHVFPEPLVPIGGQPTAAENAALVAALRSYAQRSGPDDFSSLTDFLNRHPGSPWAASLLTDLGLEYYNTAHYSLALEAWAKGWELGQKATDARGVAVADRAVAELAYMYARLGRMTQLDALLTSLNGHRLVGPAAEKIVEAHEGLWTMKNRPEVAFRCGPLALSRIKLAVDPKHPCTDDIFKSASTQQGTSLPQLVTLSKKIGLNYQMAYRTESGEFIVPSVVHWKVGHFAALIRREGDRYLLQDPTFRNDVWATRAALVAETSGYFLIPPGPIPSGWRGVDANEGNTVWGKGVTTGNDPGPITPGDPKTGPGPCQGMAVANVHLMDVNLSIVDQPLGYVPPVGSPVRLTVRNNSRDSFQPSNFNYANFGPLWTCDWISYITDTPSNVLADVTCYMCGGGQRSFTGFNTNTQSFAYQQFDQTLLTRISSNPISYEMVWPDGSKLEFGQPDGSIGTSRNIFLTQVVDPRGNAILLSYDSNLRLVAVTDAVGQVTTLSYGNTNDIYKITQVTDPFGRFATFAYDGFGRLTNITDVIGLTSQFSYLANGDFVNALTTPYGTTTFTNGDLGTTRWLETTYPDGSRDRVEFNINAPGVPDSDPRGVPQGMSTENGYLQYRDTYYWSRNACATAYGDYTKARVYHWLHEAADLNTCSGILESTKEPLEGRVWYDYAGQTAPYVTGTNNQPAHAGRVLDDGSTQLYTYAYNGFGNLTNLVDPLGRTLSYLYDTNGIDLLEIRQTRATNKELLFKATYNTQHLPLTRIGMDGQTNTYTYNPCGQLLTATDPRNETTAYTYDTNGYLIAVDGPLPGTNDMVTATYDSYGRIHTKTDVSGYTLTFSYDALDRLTQITHPDSTFEQITYNRLDPTVLQDRAGRQTLLEYDSLRQLTKRTDPLGRMTQYQWCSCGNSKSLTDPMGRTTTWDRDVQGRLKTKTYGDGSQVNYSYENTTSRLRQVIDEKLQITSFAYNLDNTLSSINYANATIPTPSVSYTYDPNYQRVTSMTDGAGTTLYSYNPIAATPTLGAGQLASVNGPLTNATITYGYDELGRRVSTAVNGASSTVTFDPAGRVLGETNVLGLFTYAYDGGSWRILSEIFPNGQVTTWRYGNNLNDFDLEGITNQYGATPISAFLYSRDNPADRIITWSQQTGAEPPDFYSFGYDAANQILSATVTNAGVLVNSFAYSYDLAGNRLSEQAGASTYNASYNGLNQLSITTAPGTSRTNEWDAANRLVAVNAGSQRTELTYDGLSRVVGIRQLQSGLEVSHRLFLWDGDRVSEECDTNGAPTKRFFSQGVQLVSGTNAGVFYYTRDHLRSVRELTDGSGNVRASYSYDPFGRRTKVSGDVDADFGFAGMFWTAEANLSLARFRAYDPGLGRWLSRDPLINAEANQGANLYVYAGSDPVNAVDPLGLCCEQEQADLSMAQTPYNSPDQTCLTLSLVANACNNPLDPGCQSAKLTAQIICGQSLKTLQDRLTECWEKPCEPPSCSSGSGSGSPSASPPPGPPAPGPNPRPQFQSFTIKTRIDSSTP